MRSDLNSHAAVAARRAPSATRRFVRKGGRGAVDILAGVVADLKDELAALRIERAPETGGSRWVAWVSALLLLGAAGAGVWFWMFREKALVVEAAAGPGARHGRRRRGRGVGPERLRLRHRPAPGHGVLQGHRQGDRGQRRGRHGGPRRARSSRAWTTPSRAPPSSSSKAQAEAARRAVRESEVRLAEAKLTLKRRLQLVEGQPGHAGGSRPGAGRSRFRRGPDPGGAAAGRGGRASDCAAADRAGQHDHPRPVQRRRAVEGRPARRDGVAGLGRRRLHPHRHLDHRRHGLARDRGRGQRGLHQPGDAEAARGRGPRRLSGLGDPGPRDHDGADGRSAEGDRARPRRVRRARSAHPARHGRQGAVPPRRRGRRPRRARRGR